MISPAQVSALAPSVYTTVARRIAAEGVPDVCKELNMRRETVLRLASGADTHEATLLLAAVRLGLLAVGSPTPMAISSVPAAGDLHQ
jgi:hypothetical protein